MAIAAAIPVGAAAACAAAACASALRSGPTCAQTIHGVSTRPPTLVRMWAWV